MTASRFFARYAVFSSGEDDRALAAVYAPSVFVAAPTGSRTFANDAHFLGWLAQFRTFNRPATGRSSSRSPICWSGTATPGASSGTCPSATRKRKMRAHGVL